MLPTILQALGVVTVSVGCGLFWLPLGIIVFGVGVLLFGLALETPSKG